MENTNTNKNIRILIADDHSLIRKGLKSLMEGIDFVEIVAEADNGPAVLAWLSHPDLEVEIVLMDIRMPHKDGIEVTKIIAEKYPNIKVIGLSMFQEISYIKRILKAGAMGYLLKTTGQDELIKAIKTVHSGKPYLSPEVTQLMMGEFISSKHAELNKTNPQTVKLSERETQILTLITNEYTNKEIGESLFISPRTVDSHRRNIMDKIAVKNTAGLVKYALLNNIL